MTGTEIDTKKGRWYQPFYTAGINQFLFQKTIPILHDLI